MVLADILIEDQQLGILREHCEKIERIEALLVGLVPREKYQELEVLLAGLDIVLEDENVRHFLHTHPKNAQGFPHLKILLAVPAEDRQDGQRDLYLLELRRPIIGDRQRRKRILFLQHLQQMRRKHQLVVREAPQQGTQPLYDGGVTDVRFSLCHGLLAQHRHVVNRVVLDHVKHVLFEAHAVALRKEVQHSRRRYLNRFALSRQNVLEHAHLLQIFVCIETRSDQRDDDLQFCIAVLDLVQN